MSVKFVMIKYNIYIFIIFLFSNTNLNGMAPVTIFIHGTLYPVVNLFIRAFDLPLGLIPAKDQGDRLIHGRIAYILNKADPKKFNLDNFYFFGWSGSLNPKARRDAALELYDKIKDIKAPIQIIGHSHGGNIALHLAQIAKENNNKKFKVKELFLLACPVIASTEDNIKSNVFQKVFSFYSLGDRTQIRDPQYLFSENRNYAKKIGKNISFFSRRTFSPCPNKLIQRRVLYDKRNIGHLDFIYKPFIFKLPDLIKLIERSLKRGYFNNKNREYILNIDRDLERKPGLLVKYRNSCAKGICNL